MRISWWSRIGLLLAVGFFVAAGHLYRESVRVRDSHVWMPLSIPLALAPSEIESPEFFAQNGVSYAIELDTHRTGISVRDVDISWAILEKETVVKKGESSEFLGSTDGDDLVLGSFRAGHDGNYKLQTKVRNLDGTPGSPSPTLIVVLEMDEREDIVVGESIYKYEAGICGFLGSMALAFAVTGIIAKHRRVAVDRESGGVKSV